MTETFYEAGSRALAESKRIRRERAMTKPDDIPQDVWSVSDAVRHLVFNAMHDDDGRLTDSDPSEIIARAIMAEREAGEKRTVELLLNPAAVYVNWLRGTIDARSIIADEREACARVLDEGYDRIGIVTKHDKCTHGIWDWDDCDQCAAAAIRNRYPLA